MKKTDFYDIKLIKTESYEGVVKVKKKSIIIIVIIIILVIALATFVLIKRNTSNKDNDTQDKTIYETLKKDFEEYSIVKIYINKGSSQKDVDNLYSKIKNMKYFKNIELVTKEDAYQKMKKLYSNDSDLINKINIDDLQEYITAGCYYLDDITLLDEDSYFEKIKADINNVDENKIISNIITVGIIDLYNQEGIEGVNNYIEKSNKINSNSDTSVSTNETLNTDSQAENATQKIMNDTFFSSGKITKIDNDYIYFLNANNKLFYIEKSMFNYLNGRTCKNINIADINIGDYLDPVSKQILIFRNITGDELENELLYNMTLTYDERIKYQNTIEIENINIINEDMARVTIKYGDIIGDTLTDETFETSVEFNNNTKFYSKGNDINSIKNLENAKGNINSICLEKNSINKKNLPIVKTFESTDT